MDYRFGNCRRVRNYLAERRKFLSGKFLTFPPCPGHIMWPGIFVKKGNVVMNKNDLIAKVSTDTGYTVNSVSEIINAFVDEVSVGVLSGERVMVSGLGIFKSVVRKSRKARNVHTGEIMVLPETKAVSFKPAKVLTDALKKEG